MGSLRGWKSLGEIKFVQRTNWNTIFGASPDDRVYHRPQKLLIARKRNSQRLDGKPHPALAQEEPIDRR